MYSCMYYNLYVAATVTSTGRSLVSTLGMFFEQFLANNVKFGSLNEVVTFIHNVISEKPNRAWKDYDILDRDITYQECYIKLMSTAGFEWVPTEEDMQTIWDIIINLPQEDINRIYYKNNLYEFVLNKKPLEMVKIILRRMTTPYLNPNKCPKEIEVELGVFRDVLKEFVYYGYHIIDRIDRMDNMIKCVTSLSDTDSTIVSFDAWYNCILEQVKFDPDIAINRYSIDAVKYVKYDEIDIVKIVDPELEYNFYDEEVIETERKINLCEIIPQDNLRYSIINILAYCVDGMVNDYLISYCKQSNSYDGDCLIIAKNEFLFKTALLTDNKKNYATLQEVQEGNMVPKDKQVDEKGLAISKSSMNKTTRDALEKILYEDILNVDAIDRFNVVKKLAILESDIYKSLNSGSKAYYKPVVVKGFDSYKEPFGQQGIKASLAWNELRGDAEALDLRERNAIDIVKVNITLQSAEKIKCTYPEVYDKIVEILQPDHKLKDAFKGQIKSLAIPKDIEVPPWVKEFINYTEIINDNLKNFPLKSIGIMRQGKDTINYTNIVKI